LPIGKEIIIDKRIVVDKRIFSCYRCIIISRSSAGTGLNTVPSKFRHMSYVECVDSDWGWNWGW